jgi:hypothetical protein
MDKKVALRTINQLLLPYREKPYSELVEMIGKEPVTGQIVVPSGQCFQYEIEAFWDDRSSGNIRVLGSIDDGGMRAVYPLCSDFIKSPENTFVGE